MFQSVMAISVGAALGALLRWQISAVLSLAFPALPPGTLVANLIGGFGIGVAMAVFLQHPSLSPAWRLFIVTGFLGGLTTFSTFSAEVVLLLQQGRLLVAGGTVLAHVVGSLLMTLAGIASVQWWHSPG